MAATAHSEPYSILMRKIGYSVGLEYTLERVRDLNSVYLRDRDITLASWNELVTGEKEAGAWGRDQSASKNIGDFFQALRMIQLTQGDVLALENLDAMAIASELSTDKHSSDAAQDFIFLWSLLVNDGEIFVNFLLAGFDEDQIVRTLRRMIVDKRSTASDVLRGKDSVLQINRAITVERQENNKGSRGSSRSVTSLRRTESLESTSSFGVNIAELGRIEFSEDYFRKVPPRRREWAISLGLWDSSNGLTLRGQEFLGSLRRKGYINEQDFFTFWPMDYELVRSGFRPDIFGASKNIWECLSDFHEAFTGSQMRSPSEHDQSHALQIIQDMVKVFRSLHVRKSMLRRELPLTVAYPAAFAIFCGRNDRPFDLPSAIAAEQSGAHRRIALRPSRHTSGALSVKR